MIRFKCPKCGRAFVLGDHLASKPGKCSCGAMFTVPEVPAASGGHPLGDPISSTRAPARPSRKTPPRPVRQPVSPQAVGAASPSPASQSSSPARQSPPDVAFNSPAPMSPQSAPRPAPRQTEPAVKSRGGKILMWGGIAAVVCLAVPAVLYFAILRPMWARSQAPAAQPAAAVAPAAEPANAARLRIIKQMFVDEKITAVQYDQAKLLLGSTPSDEIDQKRAKVYADLADGALTPQYLQPALDAIAKPAGNPPPKDDMAAAEAKALEQIMGLMGAADNPDDVVKRQHDAMAALSQLLAQDPKNPEALKMQAELKSQGSKSFIDDTTGITFVRVEAGEFLMGSPDSEPGHAAWETQHRVRITKPFYLATTPVTQKQWAAVMNVNPSKHKGDDLPVEVTWNAAADFCRTLGSVEHKTYRLPTEAEWEYACRAGTTTRYNTGGDDAALRDAAWFKDDADGQSHPVGQKKANAWGLFDMHGNVWQLCSDGWSDVMPQSATDPNIDPTNAWHVVRGGSWTVGAEFCRSASRGKIGSDGQLVDVGFRPVLEIP